MTQIVRIVALGVAVEEMKAVVLGWSATKQILGKNVYNEKNEKVGKVDDIIIAPNKSVSYLMSGSCPSPRSHIVETHQSRLISPTIAPIDKGYIIYLLGYG